MIFEHSVRILSSIHINSGTWEKTSGKLEEVVSLLKDKKIGVAGFCWGGMAAIKAVGKIPAVRAAALIHPSRVTLEDCEIVHGPVLFLPSKDEPDMVQILGPAFFDRSIEFTCHQKPCFEAVQKKPFGALAEHHRFDDMHHGWCATRGNFADENNAKRATEAIELIANFYAKVFSDKSALQRKINVHEVKNSNPPYAWGEKPTIDFA